MFGFVSPPERIPITEAVADWFRQLEELRIGAFSGKADQFVTFFESYFGKEKRNRDDLNFFNDKYFKNDLEYKLYCAAWEVYQSIPSLVFSKEKTITVVNGLNAAEVSSSYYLLNEKRENVTVNAQSAISSWVGGGRPDFVEPAVYVEYFEKYFGKRKFQVDCKDFSIPKKGANNKRIYDLAWEDYQYWKNFKFDQKAQTTDVKKDEKTPKSKSLLITASEMPGVKFFFRKPDHAFVASLDQKEFTKVIEEVGNKLGQMISTKTVPSDSKKDEILKFLPVLTNPNEIIEFLKKLSEYFNNVFQTKFEYFDLDLMVNTVEKYFKQNPNESFNLRNAKGIVLLSLIYVHQSEESSDRYFTSAPFFEAAGLAVDDKQGFEQAIQARKEFTAKLLGVEYLPGNRIKP